jgi:hypothetical protein
VAGLDRNGWPICVGIRRLLTNDAITLAVMKRYHLRNIATNDPDFERVTDLLIWKPNGLTYGVRP